MPSLNLWLVLAQIEIHKELESNFHLPYKGGRENIPSLDSLVYVSSTHCSNQKCNKILFTVQPHIHPHSEGQVTQVTDESFTLQQHTASSFLRDGPDKLNIISIEKVPEGLQQGAAKEGTADMRQSCSLSSTYICLLLCFEPFQNMGANSCHCISHSSLTSGLLLVTCFQIMRAFQIYVMPAHKL